MKTSKRSCLFYKTVCVAVSMSLALPPVSAFAGDDQSAARVTSPELSRFECVKSEYKHSDGKIYAVYVKAGEQHYRFHREGNWQKNLYEKPDCTKELNAHLFKKEGPNGKTVEYMHWHPDGPKTKGEQIPLTAVNWTQEARGVSYPLPEVDDNPEAKIKRTAAAPELGSTGAVGSAEKPKDVEGANLGAESNDAITKISRALLAKDQYDEDLAKQIGKFLWKEPWAFIDEAFRQASPQIDPPVQVIITKMVKVDLQDARDKFKAENEKADTGIVLRYAAVYYILGAGEGAAGELGELLKGREELEELLSRLLYDFKADKGDPGVRPTVSVKLGESCSDYKADIGVLKKGSGAPVDWVTAFVCSSREYAWGLLNIKMSPEQIRDLAKKKADERGTGIGGQNPSKEPPGGGLVTPTFELDYLFGKWGDKNVFHINGRKLALVPRMERRFVKASDGTMAQEYVQKFGLYDISSPAKVYGRIFDINELADGKFSLKEGGKRYVMNVTPKDGVDDYDISVKGLNGEGEAKYEPVFGREEHKMPGMNDLFKLRAEKALNSGLVTKFGDKEYIVAAESGGSAYFTYWSRETLQKMKDGKIHPRRVVPDGMAHVTKANGDRVSTVADQSPTGLNVGGKWYDIRQNKETGVWHPVEGKEPAPTPEEKKEEAKDAAPTTTSASGGAQAGGDFRSYGGHDATHASVAKVNIELAAKGLRLHKQEGKERFILGGKGTDRTEDSYIRSSGGGDLKGFKEFRLAGDTLLAEYAAGISYIDVGRGLRAEKYERDGYIYYKGFYTNEATKAFSGTDAEAFADALLKMGYSQSLIRTIAGRAAAIVKANTSQAPTFWAYHTEDGVKTAKISFPNGTEAEIYPGDGSVVIAYPDIGQKGIVFDFKEQGIPSEFTAQSFNVPSAESLKVGEDVSENVVALGKEDVAEASDLDSARLYKATKGSRSAWYLKFKITSGSKKAFVTPQMLVFEDRPADPAKSGSRSEFPGKGIVIGGVDLGALKNAEELNIKPDWTPTTGQPWKLKFVKMADGAPKDKGAIALVDPTGMQRFIAVVAYWGVTKEAAEERAKQKGV